MSAEQPEVAQIRPGDELDWAALEAYLRGALEDLPAEPMGVLQFPRGTANLTYQLSFGGLRLVLRRPPFGKTAPGAHDMAREYSILSRLWRAYPRAPRAHVLCEDAGVIGAPFTVQEYRRDGVVIFGRAPSDMAGIPDLGERLTRAVVDALADLHQVDFAAAGLSDLGRPEGFVQRQLAGWRDRWRRVASAADDGLMEKVAERLERETPASRLRSVIHNDYKLDNCQFRAGDPDRVVSVFDWDMATLGDPLIDIGITLAYWPIAQRQETLGLPPRAVVARLYAERMGVEPDALRWYEAFACWRNAVATQQLYDRYARGLSHDDRLASAAYQVGVFAERAAATLDGASG